VALPTDSIVCWPVYRKSPESYPLHAGSPGTYDINEAFLGPVAAVICCDDSL